MSNIKLTIRFFGHFRQFGEGIDLTVPKGSNVTAVKLGIQERLNGEKLVQDSVLANDHTILREEDVLNTDTELSILPPVCGG